MAVTAIIGGQFGSEGKGKIAGYLAGETHVAVRSGGPNAGHTVHLNGQIHKFRALPCAALNPATKLCIAAGAVLNEGVLLDEIRGLGGLKPGRLLIDPYAALIDVHHAQQEKELVDRIGSTGQGVGAAIAAKVRRDPNLRLAKDSDELKRYLADVAEAINHAIDARQNIVLEGTQGFGLSLHHGDYPKVTGRDTTAASLCSDAGVSPRAVETIILVIRTFPIRVAGESGPLENEIDWGTLEKESGASGSLVEQTTVTKKIRRIARFNIERVKRAALINRPTDIALMFADHIDQRNHGRTRFEDLTQAAKDFVLLLEREVRVPVSFIGTGPAEHMLIDRRPGRAAID